jgi:hypothetical protein
MNPQRVLIVRGCGICAINVPCEALTWVINRIIQLGDVPEIRFYDEVSA